MTNKFDDLPVHDIGKVTKMLQFTDIHFGARNNSDQHNQDCLDFIDWFIKNCEREKPSHIAFLGDWFENRNQVSIKTLDYSQRAARRLNELGIPVIFIVGNHDLYKRNDRSIFSTTMFHDLSNFVVVDKPMYLDKKKTMLATPFLFKPEYPELAAQINSAKYVFGHFEFRNFVVTGADRVMEHGPDAEAFNGPDFIFSGHFHKRQASKNIIYIGNTFPTNYGDAGDCERGLCIFDRQDGDDISFVDWPRAPLFFKTRLSRMLAESIEYPKNARVRCILDMDVSYSEVQGLKEEMVDLFKLREFSIELDGNLRREMISDGLEIDSDVDLSTLDNTVRQLISEGVAAGANINPAVLIELYEGL